MPPPVSALTGEFTTIRQVMMPPWPRSATARPTSTAVSGSPRAVDADGRRAGRGTRTRGARRGDVVALRCLPPSTTRSPAPPREARRECRRPRHAARAARGRVDREPVRPVLVVKDETLGMPAVPDVSPCSTGPSFRRSISARLPGARPVRKGSHPMTSSRLCGRANHRAAEGCEFRPPQHARDRRGRRGDDRAGRPAPCHHPIRTRGLHGQGVGSACQRGDDSGQPYLAPAA